MYSRLIVAVFCFSLSFAGHAEPLPGHNEPPHRELPKGGHLIFHHAVTLRGVLTYGENHLTGYSLATPVSYTTTLPVSARETRMNTGVSTFWVKAPRKLSLVWYRNRQVEVSGHLVPEGRFHTPTIIVDSIRLVRRTPKHLTNR
jgi:hypothetical protein